MLLSKSDIMSNDAKSWWNTWNARHIEPRTTYTPAITARRNFVLSALKNLNLDRPDILEVGCGTGWLCEEMLAFGNVTGTDLADEVIERANKRVPKARFVAGDFLSLELPKESFDVVVTIETIAHIGDHQSFIEKIASLLKPRGYLILTTQNRWVFKRMETMQVEHPHSTWLNMTEALRAVLPKFSLIKASTVLPEGHMGVLRYVNSYRLDTVCRKLGILENVNRLKEGLGLGQTITIIAKKKA